MTTMTFANPQYLILLIALPMAIGVVYWAVRSRSRTLDRIGSPRLVSRLTASVNTRGRLVGRGLAIAGLGLAIVALARPQWGESVQTVQREGAQIIVALDISRSMLAEDVKPSRLVRAKLEIDDIMQKLQGDEIGLVLFSGAAFLQFPMTFDYSSARNFIENANTEMISRQGTNISEAIEIASLSFNDELISQRVILIVTDGEDQSGDAVEAAQAAADNGILVYAIGVGATDGEPIPLRADSGRLIRYVQDAQGNMVFSRLNEDALISVAEAGGGKFIRLEGSANAADQFVEELSELQRSAVGSEIETTKIERFQVFALAAIALLIGCELIPDRRRTGKSTTVGGTL